MSDLKSACGIQIKRTKSSKPCRVCLLTKMTQAPYPHQSDTRASAPGQTLHVDLCGPMEVESEQGSRYAMPVTDDFSRFTIVFFLRKKSDAVQFLVEAIKRVESHTGNKVVQIRADNGGEFVSNSAKSIFANLGVTLLTSVPYSPQQNGVAERKNRTLVTCTRATLRTSSMPKHFWQYAMATAAHVINRVPTDANNGKSPFELWNGVVPDISHVRVFGCKAYALKPKKKRSKFSDVSTECVFLGYPFGQKGYLMMDLATKRKFACRSVSFEENEFPFRGAGDNNTDHRPSVLENPSQNEGEFGFDSSDDNETRGTQNDTVVDQCPSHELNFDVPGDDEHRLSQRERAPNEIPPNKLNIDSSNDDENDCAHEKQAAELDSNGDEIDAAANDIGSDSVPGDREDDSNDGNYLENFVQQERPANENEPVSRPTRNRRPPSRLIDEIDDFRLHIPRHHAFTVADMEPISVKEAIMNSGWKAAMDREYDSLIKNHTWDLVPLPPGRNAISGKWIFKEKTDERGNVIRKKARFVARGFSQAAGVDFDETYSPVISHTSLRLMLSISASLDLELYQMDVDTAYLYGELEEELFMEQPDGYEVRDNNGNTMVCRLRKSIYGLKQAGRCWWRNLDSFLRKNGFRACVTEPCLYKRESRSQGLTLIAVYVDDLVVAAPSQDTVKMIESMLSSTYSMKDAVILRFVLGIHVQRDRPRRTISLHQSSYTRSILTRFDMIDSNPVKTPSDPSHQCVTSSTAVHHYPYRQAVGALMYLMTCTRPDLAYSVSKISRSSHKPTESDVVAVKRVFRYLKGTISLGIRLGGSNPQLLAYADADFGSDISNRRSISGNVVFFGDGPVAWCSRRQECVTLSTVESEYVSLCEATKQVIWLRALLQELELTPKHPTIIFEDNRGTISLAEGNALSKRSKHISIKYHFVREVVGSKKVELIHCSSGDMIADIMTKALGPILFLKHRDKICHEEKGGSGGSVDQ